MTGWEWFAGSYGDVESEGFYSAGGCPTRDAAIEDLALQGIEEIEGQRLFYVIEARSSTAKRTEGADFVPFVRTRNHEMLELGELQDARAEALCRALL